MPPLSAARTFNASFSPSYVPVALFVGGTSGIGQGMAEAFARYTKGNAHIIIIGRNQRAAEAIISSFPKPTVEEDGEPPVHEFVPCDASLMKNVHATTTELLSRLPKVNFLVLSPGYLSLSSEETEEGIDARCALYYYARWKFTNDLLPLLRNAKDAGEDAKVMSILAAGRGGQIDPNDLGLKNNHSFVEIMKVVPTYTDLMMEELAAREPEMAFTHVHPGVVRTNILLSTHGAVRLLAWLLHVFSYPLQTSKEDCAEYMLSTLFDREKGAFRSGETGDDIGKKNYFVSLEARKKLWEHTAEVVGTKV